MNIPIPEKGIQLFHVASDGKELHDGMKSPRFLCDGEEIPVEGIESVEITLECDKNTVQFNLGNYGYDGQSPFNTKFGGKVTFHPRAVQIDGYVPITTRRREARANGISG